MWQYRGQRRPPFAEAVQPGQESVWDYPRPPAISEDSRRVVVKAGGRLLADSLASLRVAETASPPTFYLPCADIDMELLTPVEGRSVCEWKGAAKYWSLRDASRSVVIAWGYPQPNPSYAALLGRLCFYPGRVSCYVNGERVRPQPGEFYGGWVTDELAGPFKGEPGTGHW